MALLGISARLADGTRGRGGEGSGGGKDCVPGTYGHTVSLSSPRYLS